MLIAVTVRNLIRLYFSISQKIKNIINFFSQYFRFMKDPIILITSVQPVGNV